MQKPVLLGHRPHQCAFNKQLLLQVIGIKSMMTPCHSVAVRLYANRYSVLLRYELRFHVGLVRIIIFCEWRQSEQCRDETFKRPARTDCGGRNNKHSERASKKSFISPPAISYEMIRLQPGGFPVAAMIFFYDRSALRPRAATSKSSAPAGSDDCRVGPATNSRTPATSAVLGRTFIPLYPSDLGYNGDRGTEGRRKGYVRVKSEIRRMAASP